MAKSFAVFGLGRFGTSIVKTLSASQNDVLVVDRDPKRVNKVADLVDQALIGEAGDEELLQRIGIEHFDVVVFAMGEDFEGSVMATMAAKELGAKRIIVKALTRRQALILERVGADKVILPEVEMGAKLAKSLINPNLMEVIDQVNGVDIIEQRPEPEWVGRTIKEARLRQTAHLEVVALIRNGQVQLPINPTTVLKEDDVLLTLESHINEA